jgi:patatin-like phospholipase/acyl hydrolase
VSDPVRVLTIDGGGIRGIIPATVLADLELRAGRPVAELFDLAVGTSTGGILALALTAPGEHGGPRWRAEDLVDLYVMEGPRIFQRSIFDRIRSVDGALDEKYPSDGLVEVLTERFGDLRLHEALVDVMVTAYDTVARSPFFFRSSRARSDPAQDWLARDAAHATSAAPSYFEPVKLDDLSLIDGGVFAANPAMCGIAEVLRAREPRDVVMVSLGTGEHTRPLPWKTVRDWGALEWARPVIDIVLDGQSDTVDFQSRQVLGDRYWRVQTELAKASDALDDATDDNLQALQDEAGALVERESSTLATIAEALKLR